MRQCDNGHFYDESRFDSCPYCQEGAGVGKTVAAGTVGKTVAAVPGGAAPEADRGKTVGIIKKKIGIDPAVGFLVCVSGPHRGADPEKAMHWLHMTPSITAFPFLPARAGASLTATTNRWKWYAP